ncbi:MAG TPA: MlaD family protein, partial [Acidimicrobiales bacterium]|nr:MlaD family protein [Acidimicrobiales bacterium]
MGRLTDRGTRIMTGLITMVFIGAMGTFAVRAATGSLRPMYHLTATFSAAGQGLIRDSDVKIHGVPIGRVTKVKLVEGRARVTMEISKSQRIPVDAKATIRPKTLFGEKFIDVEPGDNEVQGPFLQDGDVLEDTLGGFELERVLADAFPILQAIDPVEL